MTATAPSRAHSTVIANFERFVVLNDAERQAIIDRFHIKQVRKKQMLVQPGFVCGYRTYVVEGAIRAFFICSNMQEHNIALAVDDWWITDYSSYHFQQPASMFLEAVEASTILQISYQDEEDLLREFPVFERFFRIVTQRSFARLQQRLMNNLSQRAEERYDDMVRKYPKLVARFPQYVIASFLGMTTEFLSKIKRKQALEERQSKKVAY